MSHQATFMGRFTEAASLARAARAGTPGVATPTLTAHFHAMEARGLARLGDAKACMHALSESMREFERATPEDDPEWIRYFNESELSAEFGHCMRDLGRSSDAIQHAGSGLAASGEFVRSDFFVSIVLADAHVKAGDIEQACNITLRALAAGDQIRSARCVSYLREFMTHLPVTDSRILTDFREQVSEAMLKIYQDTGFSARANRAFLVRAVRFLAGEAGIRQFLDIGTGIPTAGNTHEVAQAIAPESRVFYVDHDQVVLAHARALLTSNAEDATQYSDGDLRNTGPVLTRAAQLLDFTRPVAVTLLSILHAVPDDCDPCVIVATLMDAVPPGTSFAVSRGASDLIDPVAL
jgi:hypothetical protein